ncbi:hypothetical protein GCM10027180_32450 [Microbulbifer echini]
MPLKNIWSPDRLVVKIERFDFYLNADEQGKSHQTNRDEKFCVVSMRVGDFPNIPIGSPKF